MSLDEHLSSNDLQMTIVKDDGEGRLWKWKKNLDYVKLQKVVDAKDEKTPAEQFQYNFFVSFSYYLLWNQLKVFFFFSNYPEAHFELNDSTFIATMKDEVSMNFL